MKETTLSKVIGISMFAAGVYIAVKNHKQPGFWTGMGASILLFGVFSLKIYDKASA